MHLGTAGLSVAILNRFGAERLKELEKKEIIHRATSCGSLDSAMNTIVNYFINNQTPFSKDAYEQLERVCYSAESLLIDKINETSINNY